MNGRAFPMLLLGAGFLFIYAGVKDRNPLQIAKDIAQGRNPGSRGKAGPLKNGVAEGEAGAAAGAGNPPSTPGAAYYDSGPIPTPPTGGGAGNIII